MSIKIIYNCILLFIFTTQSYFLLEKYHIVDKEFQSINNYFMGEVTKYCKPDDYFYPNKTSIMFSNLPKGMLGVCARNMIQWEIMLDRTEWYNEEEYQVRFSTLIHELTHCVLKLDHSDDPSHYMYYSESGIPEIVVKQQLELILRERCKK